MEICYGNDHRVLRAIAEKLIEKALQGDLRAIQQIADRWTESLRYPAGALQSLFFLSFLSSLSLALSFLRLVKRALPNPVPMVSTPQRSTSCMNGASESPCATPSLCISTAVS